MPNSNSLDLERTSSQFAFITDANQTGLDITGDISMECYVKVETLPSGSGANNFGLITKVGTDNESYYMILGGGDSVNVFYSSDGGATYWIKYTTTYDVTAGTWIHLAATIAVATQAFVIYADTVSQTLGSVNGGTPTAIYNGTARFIIGAYDAAVGTVDTSTFYDGLIDEVRVWNDIRTSTEISDNYQLELVGNEAGLAGYWQLDNDYLDMTANNNDLTATGSPVFSTDVPFDGAGAGGTAGWRSLMGVGN